MRVLSSLLLLAVAFFAFASASHYRYGTISWVNVGSNTANFTFESSWRRSYFTGIQVGSKVDLGLFTFGDGTQVGQTGYVTTVNLAADWFICISYFSHTYPSANVNGLPFTATYSGTARIGSLRNNANMPWYLTTTVDLTVQSSPRSKMLPIANVLYVQNANVSFQVPAVTDDNSQIHYSLGTSTQICGPGKQCYNPINLQVDAVTGVVTWNLASSPQILPGLWCAVIMISTDKVSVPVDFIVNYTQVAGKCATGCTNQGKACTVSSNCGQCTSSPYCLKPLPPVFISPSPSQNVTMAVSSNQLVNFTLAAMSPQNSSVTIQESTIPSGAVVGPNVGTNPVTRQFTWTPDNTQQGPSIVCFSASDAMQYTTAQYCITIEVSVGCNPACGANSACIGGQCVCESGYYGDDCSQYGGLVIDGQTVYATVPMHQSNFYFFNVTNSNNAIKIIVEAINPNFATSLYVSTSNPNPSITSNDWDAINQDPNTIVILPSDPHFTLGTYYLAVEGWYCYAWVPSIDYNLTIFLS